MNILGIHYGHNATVCLIQDGTITFAQSEERLNRIKNSTGFPSLTLEHVYEQHLAPEDVDRVVLFQESPLGYVLLRDNGFESVPFTLDISPALIDKSRWLPRPLNDVRWKVRDVRTARLGRQQSLNEESRAYFSSALRVPPDRIETIRHHDAHAYAALTDVADDEPTLIFTLDGSGDGECATVQLWRDGRLESLSRDDHRHSLGFYYAWTTAILGMRPAEHEFKVMGLAPYASPDRVARLLPKLRACIRVDDQGHFRSVSHGLRIAADLEAIYRFERFDVISGAIQALTEELVLQWVRYWVARTGCDRVALGGGVFMNVKASQLVAEIPEVKDVYVVPSAGDESCAVGAAVAGFLRSRPARELRPLGPLYLGMGFDDRDVEKTIRDTGAASDFDITPDVGADVVADLLASGEVVARCVGRMEYGARSLGNRSILADPSRANVVEHINAMIKNRDFWMPFAPTILSEDMPRYVEPTHATYAPYMTITFHATPLGRTHLAAAVHPRDHTARPQELRRSWNEEYYDLIARFKERTGIGGILNTSFNLHGEPNVCTPADAIRTTRASGLRHLVLGRHLLTKRTGAGSTTASP